MLPQNTLINLHDDESAAQQALDPMIDDDVAGAVARKMSRWNAGIRRRCG
ncbi:MAG: hypothetical protein HC828_19220 [Blastochloris sp.]|nr:hypothetical protein [Blastochloris sp.]